MDEQEALISGLIGASELAVGDIQLLEREREIYWGALVEISTKWAQPARDIARAALKKGKGVRDGNL